MDLRYGGARTTETPNPPRAARRLNLANGLGFLLTDSRREKTVPRMADHLDAYFGAMSDPTRRAVIERLTLGPAAVAELHAPHAMALPSFLKHLNRLEAAGIVRSVKKGRSRIVHIEAAPLASAEDWLARQRSIWDARTDRLAAFAADLESRPRD